MMLYEEYGKSIGAKGRVCGWSEGKRGLKGRRVVLD
jgi:hypothetical protein